MSNVEEPNSAQAKCIPYDLCYMGIDIDSCVSHVRTYNCNLSYNSLL